MKKKPWWKPTKVSIGSFNFKIKYVIPGKGKNNPLLKGENACIVQDMQCIYVDRQLSSQLTLLAILHEFCHAIGDTIRSNKNPFAKEEFTYTVSSLLLQALQSSGLLSK